jgi:hypothetical protein
VGVVGAFAGDAGACDVAGTGCVRVGCVGCTDPATRVACLLGVTAVVAEAVVVRPAVVPPPGEAGDVPEFAATMMMINAMKARSPVSALWRAGQDLPRGGRLGGCGGW